VVVSQVLSARLAFSLQATANVSIPQQTRKKDVLLAQAMLDTLLATLVLILYYSYPNRNSQATVSSQASPIFDNQEPLQLSPRGI